MDRDEKKRKKKRNHLPIRLNLLFLTVFLAFSILILRLGVVQIVNGQDYQDKLKATKNKTTKLDSARGKIYGTNAKVLADNQAELAVVFIRKPNSDNLKIAKKLADYIDMDTSKVTERDEKDYYILTHYDKLADAYKDKLSAAELKKYENSADKKDQLLREHITSKDLASLSSQDMEVIAIKRELDQSTNLTPHFIKKGLSAKELALIGEHLSEFNGSIDTAVASKRKYPNGDYFFLGQVKDIPAQQINEYLAKGYNRNDKVGVSNLEKEYEDILRGIPTELSFTTKHGEPVDIPTKKEGQRGDDLELTVNATLQSKVGTILEKNIKETRRNTSDNGKLDSAYAIVMDPHTGGVLAISGRTLNRKTGKFENTSSDTIYKAFQMGSAVKGATETAGYQTNTIPEKFNDKPIHFKGKAKNTFSSYTSSIGVVNPEQALEHSSNVFMAKIASNMAGFTLDDQGGYYLATVRGGDKFVHAFKTLREVYGQFGLGVHTGIDLPSESVGYEGTIQTDQPGKIMQFAIGQYDTYTPLQLAQYGCTIANGGYRMAPHFLDSVHAPTNDVNKLGPTIYKYEPKILNHIKISQHDLDRIHKGFYLVTHAEGGTAPQLGHGDNTKYKIAAKTGTAQIDQNDLSLYNKTLISYAPYDDPQVVVAVVVPSIKSGEANVSIAADIYKAYSELKNPDQKKNKK
jgi:cell division protein FtsI/penicillin-binding protein 2